MLIRTLFALTSALALLPIAASASDDERPFGPVAPGRPIARAPKPAEGRTPMADASNAFAFDLYAKLAADKRQEGKNLFFSPYSITTALDMVTEGARAETAEQMGAVLRYPAGWRRAGDDAKARPWDEAPVHAAVESLTRRFAEQPVPAELAAQIDAARAEHKAELAVAEKMRASRSQDYDAYLAQMAKAKKVAEKFDALVAKMPGYELSIANALWGERTFAFVPEYMTSLSSHYGAALNPVDFIHNPDGVRLEINEWIAKKTKDRIKDMLKPPAVTSTTRLILANAIYFYGTWQVPFEAQHTKAENFLTGEGKSAVPMMNKQRMEHVQYAAYNGDGTLFATPDMVHGGTKPEECYPDQKGFLVAELPYKGDGLVMTIFAPQSPDGLPALEKMLTAENVREWVSRLVPRKTNVALPKFKFKTTYNLNQPLAELGMPRAFAPDSAQFEGISAQGGLYIGFVQHDAYVDVNEKGTEAAAATVIGMLATGAPPSAWPFVPNFRADRPFVFLIRDRVTETILFVGRVTKPEV